jgi:hypothetical protein
MDPALLSGRANRPQEPRWRRRRCLLKGCGQWFRPTHPRCRYCSQACRVAARRWQHWRAQQRYRASRNGRQHRQQQGQRYRQRCRSRPPPLPPPLPACSPASAWCAAGVRNRGGAACEGKRTLQKTIAGPLGPCDRPGCYVLCAGGAADTSRRFCCGLCRRALRCVLDREARWRRRRRRGLRRPGRRARRPIRGP